MYNKISGKLIISRDVIFQEEDINIHKKHAETQLEEELQEEPQEVTLEEPKT